MTIEDSIRTITCDIKKQAKTVYANQNKKKINHKLMNEIQQKHKQKLEQLELRQIHRTSEHAEHVRTRLRGNGRPA